MIAFCAPGSPRSTPPLLRVRLSFDGNIEVFAEPLATERPLLADDLRLAREIYVGNSARGMLRAVLHEDQSV